VTSASGAGRFVLGALMAVVVGCASVPPDQRQRDALMLEAAHECQPRFATIRSINGIDHYGRLKFTFQDSGAENAAFTECYRRGTEDKLRAANLLSNGHLAADSAELARTTVPLTFRHGTPVVRVSVNGSRPLSFQVDTGSSITLMSPATAAELGLSPPFTARSRILTVLGGGTVTAPTTRVRRLAVGDLALEDLDIGVVEVPELDGLLGGDVLQHFRLAVDRDGQRLTLEVASAAGESRRFTAPAPPGPH
jgi:aspartyl protease